MSRKIARPMSVNGIIGSVSSVINKNVKIFKSAILSFSRKLTYNKKPNSIPQSDFQNCGLLNENFNFTNHSNISRFNYDLQENFKNNESAKQCKFNSLIPPLNSTYAVSCSTMTTITTSVLTSSVMSSSYCSPITANVLPTLSNYRPHGNFELNKNPLYTPVQIGNLENEAFVNNPNVQSSHTLQTFLPQNCQTSNHGFHFKKRGISGFVAESTDKACNNKTSDENVIMSDVVPLPESPPLTRNSENISPASPTQFAPTCFTLPPISIEKFDGNISDYMEFKIKVESLLTMSLYPDRLKVIYLKSYLCGEPLDSTSGIMPDDPGAYNDIWSILDEDYGMPDLVRDHHLSLLLSINSWPLCTTNVNLKKLYRHVSTHYRILKKFGCDAIEEAEAVKVFILPLLTGYAGYKVAKLHQDGNNYNIPEILKILKSIISHQKFIESAKSIKTNSKLTKQPNHSSKENDLINNLPKIEGSFQSSNVSHPIENKVSSYEKSSSHRFTCQICQTDSHHHTQCNKYQNRDEFWNHITKHRLCGNCLIPGHKWRECFKEHSCKLGCGRRDKHAPVLCRKFYL